MYLIKISLKPFIYLFIVAFSSKIDWIKENNDNNNKHSDSRTYGLIDKKDIIGDVSLKYYPFKEFNYQFK